MSLILFLLVKPILQEKERYNFIGMGQTVGICNKVADKLKVKVNLQQWDLRTLSPLDEFSFGSC